MNAVEGKFLALDLGGTNFRVLLIELIGEELHHDTEIFTIKDELRNGTGEEVGKEALCSVSLY